MQSSGIMAQKSIYFIFLHNAYSIFLVECTCLLHIKSAREFKITKYKYQNAIYLETHFYPYSEFTFLSEHSILIRVKKMSVQAIFT